MAGAVLQGPGVGGRWVARGQPPAPVAEPAFRSPKGIWALAEVHLAGLAGKGESRPKRTYFSRGTSSAC